MMRWLAALTLLLYAACAASAHQAATRTASAAFRPRARVQCAATEAPSFPLDAVELRHRAVQRESGLHREKVEVLQQMEPFVEKHLNILKTVEESWQPQDFLPDYTAEDWVEQTQELRRECAGLSDEVLIAVVGDTVTEEALPTYQTLLNSLDGMDDPSGVSQNPWARWSRGWTSEENRHGDLLNKFLYLSGRVDMRAMEVTVQHLLQAGFDLQAAKDPYRGIVYTSFQERATKISHQNVARLCGDQGAKSLAMLTTRIAGDEARHEKAYQTFMQEIFRLDPSNAMISFADMMKSQIAMPAEAMTDGSNPHLFDDFSRVAQKIGVYTARDYAEILAYLVEKFDAERITGLTPEAAEAQDLVCTLPQRYIKLADRSMKRLSHVDEAELHQKFSWLKPRSGS